jgi:hypothetical protein
MLWAESEEELTAKIVRWKRGTKAKGELGEDQSNEMSSWHRAGGQIRSYVSVRCLWKGSWGKFDQCIGCVKWIFEDFRFR